MLWPAARCVAWLDLQPPLMSPPGFSLPTPCDELPPDTIGTRCPLTRFPRQSDDTVQGQENWNFGECKVQYESLYLAVS